MGMFCLTLYLVLCYVLYPFLWLPLGRNPRLSDKEDMAWSALGWVLSPFLTPILLGLYCIAGILAFLMFMLEKIQAVPLKILKFVEDKCY